MNVIDEVKKILLSADDNAAVMLGNTLAYDIDGITQYRNDLPLNDYEEEIIKSHLFICDLDNMQIFIRLR